MQEAAATSASPGKEKQDHDDHDVGEYVGDPRCQHALGSMPNDAHHESVDGGETYAESASREPVDMERAEGDGLAGQSGNDRAKGRLERVLDHASIRCLFDGGVDHREENGSDEEHRQRDIGHEGVEQVSQIGPDHLMPEDERDRRQGGETNQQEDGRSVDRALAEPPGGTP